MQLAASMGWILQGFPCRVQADDGVDGFSHWGFHDTMGPVFLVCANESVWVAEFA